MVITNSTSCKGSHHFYIGHLSDMVNEQHAVYHVPPVFPGDGTPALDCLLPRLETGEWRLLAASLVPVEDAVSVDVETELSEVVCIEDGLDECEETCPSLLLPNAVGATQKQFEWCYC